MRHNGIPMIEYNIHAILPPVVAGAIWPYPVENQIKNQIFFTFFT